jgi:hypothetical protein
MSKCRVPVAEIHALVTSAIKRSGLASRLNLFSFDEGLIFPQTENLAMLEVIGVSTLIVVSIAASLPLAHALEWPGKMAGN